MHTRRFPIGLSSFIRGISDIKIKRSIKGISSNKNLSGKKNEPMFTKCIHYEYDRLNATHICETNVNFVEKLTLLAVQRTEDRLKRSEARLKSTRTLFYTIQELLEKDERRLIPIGSFANGLWDLTSDLDLVFMPSTDEFTINEFKKKYNHSASYRKKMMYAVSNTLSKKLKLTDVLLLPQATVPILKFSIAKCCIDIQFCHIPPIKSALYTRTCIESDPCVSVLIDWLKYNFAKYQLKDRNGFTSYHIYCLVFHFLNSISSNIIPRPEDSIYLSPSFSWIKAANLLISGDQLALSSPTMKTNVTAGELIIHLIEYYSKVDLTTLAIDINGNIYAKRGEEDMHNFLQIVDSYFPTTIRCQAANAPSIIKDHFSYLRNELKSGKFDSLY